MHKYVDKNTINEIVYILKNHLPEYQHYNYSSIVFFFFCIHFSFPSIFHRSTFHVCKMNKMIKLNCVYLWKGTPNQNVLFLAREREIAKIVLWCIHNNIFINVSRLLAWPFSLWHCYFSSVLKLSTSIHISHETKGKAAKSLFIFHI